MFPIVVSGPTPMNNHTYRRFAAAAAKESAPAQVEALPPYSLDAREQRLEFNSTYFMGVAPPHTISFAISRSLNF